MKEENLLGNKDTNVLNVPSFTKCGTKRVAKQHMIKLLVQLFYYLLSDLNHFVFNLKITIPSSFILYELVIWSEGYCSSNHFLVVCLFACLSVFSTTLRVYNTGLENALSGSINTAHQLQKQTEIVNDIQL